MRRLIYKFLPIVILGFFLLIQPCLAGGPAINIYTKGVATKAGFEAGTTQTTLSEKIGGVIKVALSLVGVMFLALTVYAGFLWMTAAGKEEQVEKATKIIKFAVIGLIIVGAAYSITWFVVGSLVGAAIPSAQVGGGAASPCGGSFMGQLLNSRCW